MNKNSRVILIAVVAVVLILSMALAGCQSFKWGPVGTITEGEVINNGSVVVRQGDYIYYVNGRDDVQGLTDPYQNHFGKASVKGSIMKSKIDSEGNLSETAVLVPKMYNNTNNKNGLWIQDGWIYYTSPSTQTDNKGTVLVSKLEYMRTKTDGTKTQSLAIVEGTGLAYTVTPTALIYNEANKIMKVPFTDKKVKKPETVVEDVTSTLFTKGSNVIFYTKATDNKTQSNNLVYVMDGDKEPVAIVTDRTYATGEGEVELEDQKTITLTKYENKVLYYTRANGDARAQTGTYGYNFAEGFAEIKPANEVKFAESAVQNFIPLGIDKGILDVSAAKIFKYSVIAEGENEKKGEGIELSGAPTILFTEDDYLYYLIEGKLKRMNVNTETNEGSFYEEDVYKEAMTTSWFNPIKMDNYIYFFSDANYNYLYRVNYKDYKLDQAAQKTTYPKAEIVSGQTIDNDKVEGGKVPTFMSEEDTKAWIEAHLEKKDK